MRRHCASILPILRFLLFACGDATPGSEGDSVSYSIHDTKLSSSSDYGAETDASDENDVAMLEDVEGPEDAGTSVPEDVVELDDTSETDAALEDTGTVEEDVPEDPANLINEGFIGGTCESDADCGYEGGFCFTDGDGFPQGMCSLPCDLYCPDQDGMVTTFCIDAASADVNAPPGLCTMRCDYSLSETGCRPGYQCALLPRHNQPGTFKDACIPDDIDVPGPTDPTNCQQKLLDLGISFTPASNPKESPPGHPNLVCDIQDPIMLSGVIHGVSFRYNKLENEAKPMYMTCPLALAIEQTALILKENGVTDVLHLGIYNCRVISGTNKLSQHGLANAIDIRALVTADGEEYVVLNDWETGVPNPVTEAGQYLKWFTQTLYAEWIFNIILTPEYNAAHADHFHLDLTPGAHSLN